MKDFLVSFFIVLVLFFLFLFFGGAYVLDSFWGILVLCALSLAVFIQVNIKQSEKIEELEKRIKALEDEKNGG